MNVLKGGDWCTEKCGTKTYFTDEATNDWKKYFFD